MRLLRWLTPVAAMAALWIVAEGSAAQPASAARPAETAQEGTKPAPPAPPPGMVTKGERESPKPGPVPTAKDDARFWSVVRQLSLALNNEDKTAFLKLFSPRLIAEGTAKGEPVDGAVDFMSRVMAKRGNIIKLHPASTQTMLVEDSKFPLRTVIFHLEDGMSGYFGLALDGDAKIDSFSFFVMPDICPKGKDCDKATVALKDLH